MLCLQLQQPEVIYYDYMQLRHKNLECFKKKVKY